MSIKVVNKTWNVQGEYIGRGSPLGNPFRIGRDGTRHEVIRKYERWLCNVLAEDKNSNASREFQRLLQMALRGEDVVLVCFCAPLPCHGYVIKRFLEDRLSRAEAFSGWDITKIKAEKAKEPTPEELQKEAEAWGFDNYDELAEFMKQEYDRANAETTTREQD